MGASAAAAVWPASAPVSGTVSSALTREPDLLQPHVVGDRNDTLDAARDLFGTVHVRPGADEAAELDSALEGLDVDFGRLQPRLVEHQGLDLAGDDGVVDVFAGALAGAGGRASLRERRWSDEGGFPDSMRIEWIPLCLTISVL